MPPLKIDNMKLEFYFNVIRSLFSIFEIFWLFSVLVFPLSYFHSSVLIPPGREALLSLLELFLHHLFVFLFPDFLFLFFFILF